MHGWCNSDMICPNLFQLGEGYLKIVSIIAKCVKIKTYYCCEKTGSEDLFDAGSFFYSFFSSINMNFNVNNFQTLIFNVIYRFKSNEKPTTQKE